MSFCTPCSGSDEWFLMPYWSFCHAARTNSPALEGLKSELVFGPHTALKNPLKMLMYTHTLRF